MVAVKVDRFRPVERRRRRGRRRQRHHAGGAVDLHRDIARVDLQAARQADELGVVERRGRGDVAAVVARDRVRVGADDGERDVAAGDLEAGGAGGDEVVRAVEARAHADEHLVDRQVDSQQRGVVQVALGEREDAVRVLVDIDGAAREAEARRADHHAEEVDRRGPTDRQLDRPRQAGDLRQEVVRVGNGRPVDALGGRSAGRLVDEDRAGDGEREARNAAQAAARADGETGVARAARRRAHHVEGDHAAADVEADRAVAVDRIVAGIGRRAVVVERGAGAGEEIKVGKRHHHD